MSQDKLRRFKQEKIIFTIKGGYFSMGQFHRLKMNWVSVWRYLVILLSCHFFSAVATAAEWEKVYHHKPSNEVINGSKQKLIDAIESGKHIRLVLRTGAITHAMDANFLTIYKEEVFAQIDRIKGQAPQHSPLQVNLKENDHIGLYATNGEFEIAWFAN